MDLILIVDLMSVIEERTALLAAGMSIQAPTERPIA